MSLKCSGKRESRCSVGEQPGDRGGVLLADMSALETRLTATLNGLEVQLYNRSAAYCRLEQAFGLPELMQERQRQPAAASPLEKGGGYGGWRDLLPVIKLDICAVRRLPGVALLLV